MGVWIETSGGWLTYHQLRSHPSWVCGLKLNSARLQVWPLRVTPFVGVWIETLHSALVRHSGKSHPSWVCGLKQCCTPIAGSDYKSHPSWVCGLKPHTDKFYNWFDMSHPSWVCGLKLVWIYQSVSIYKSHPSWVCGLKPSEGSYTWLLWSVTPFVGVWIETELMF